MPEYSLPRTGAPPVAFTGDLLATADGSGDKIVRWHVLTLYETAGGAFVVSVEYRSTYVAYRAGPEPEHRVVLVCNSPQAVTEGLNAYRAELPKRIREIPEGVSGREKKMRQLLKSITDGFDLQVEKLLRDVPEFAERIG